MAKTWIQSFSGKVVEPGALKAEQVSRVDIGHALALKNRFSGHTREPYSVAQHCVVGSRMLDPKFKLPFLLHEVSEVYLPDIPTPIKRMTSVLLPGCSETSMSWNDLEKQHADVIFNALGLSDIRALIDSDEVHEADLRMLMTEKRDLLGPEPAPWNIDVKPYSFCISPWDWQTAEYQFNRTFAQLTWSMAKAGDE